MSSKAFTRGLTIIAAAIEAYQAFVDSDAQTTGGKLANAALAGGGQALLMSNPVTAVVDLAAPEGYKPSELYRGGAGAVATMGEALITGDTRGAEQFHERSLRGEYGKVSQLASEAGDFWAEEGIVGGLEEFWDALKWWASH